MAVEKFKKTYTSNWSKRKPCSLAYWLGSALGPSTSVLSTISTGTLMYLLCILVLVLVHKTSDVYL